MKWFYEERDGSKSDLVEQKKNKKTAQGIFQEMRRSKPEITVSISLFNNDYVFGNNKLCILKRCDKMSQIRHEHSKYISQALEKQEK